MASKNEELGATKVAGAHNYKLFFAAREQGSPTKSKLRRSNGIEERRIWCYANGRRAHVYAVHHWEHDALGLVAISDFLKKLARYLLLVAQNYKANGVNVTPITVVASIDLMFCRPDQFSRNIYVDVISSFICG
jgi:hypothetical protein